MTDTEKAPAQYPRLTFEVSGERYELAIPYRGDKPNLNFPEVPDPHRAILLGLLTYAVERLEDQEIEHQLKRTARLREKMRGHGRKPAASDVAFELTTNLNKIVDEYFAAQFPAYGRGGTNTSRPDVQDTPTFAGFDPTGGVVFLRGGGIVPGSPDEDSKTEVTTYDKPKAFPPYYPTRPIRDNPQA